MEPARLWAGAVACCFRDLGEPSSPAQRRTEPDASTITITMVNYEQEISDGGFCRFPAFLRAAFPVQPSAHSA